MHPIDPLVPHHHAARGRLRRHLIGSALATLASAAPHLKSGKLRALAVTGARRNADHPDVPTFTEPGVAGMDYEQWFGLMGPAKLPQTVVDKLAGAMAQVLQMPDVRERLVGMAMAMAMDVAMDVAPAGPQAMRRQLEDDAARWQRLARELDIKPLD